MNLPFHLKIEKRTEDIPRWLPVATSVGAVVAAFIISGVVLLFIGGDPLRVFSFFFTASFGSWGAFSDIIVKGGGHLKASNTKSTKNPVVVPKHCHIVKHQCSDNLIHIVFRL